MPSKCQAPFQKLPTPARNRHTSMGIYHIVLPMLFQWRNSKDTKCHHTAHRICNNRQHLPEIGTLAGTSTNSNSQCSSIGAPAKDQNAIKMPGAFSITSCTSIDIYRIVLSMLLQWHSRRETKCHQNTNPFATTVNTCQTLAH